MLKHQAQIGRAAGPSRPDRGRPQTGPGFRAILARAQWPEWRRRGRRRPLSDPAMDAAQRLAHRSCAGARSHAAGIEFPPQRRQPGGRGRPDAGPADHGERRWLAQRRYVGQPVRPTVEHRAWPELHRDDAPYRAPRRASFRRSSPPTMPVRCRWRAGPIWLRRIRCCGSNPSPIGRRAITSLSVFRNLWVYQGLANAEMPTLTRARATPLAGVPDRPDQPCRGEPIKPAGEP